MPDIGQLPEITEVQRLTVKPGDRLVVRTEAKLNAETAARMLKGIRAWLGVPDDVPVLILDGGVSIEVVEGLV